MELPLRDKKFFWLLVAIAVVLALEILSLMGIHIPMPYAPLVFGGFILAVGYSVIVSGFKALCKLNFSSINLLMLIAVIGAFYLGEYPEAAVVIVLYVLGERLEDLGLQSSKSALDALVKKSPKTATLKGSKEDVPIDQVLVGMIVQIKPGDIIPLDGKIVAGETSVDEATITGEPIPKDKHKGDSVFAGTLNKNGFIEVETTRLATDTTFAKIIELTFEAQANKSDTHKFIQKFSKIYTPAVIAIAFMIFLIPVAFMNESAEKWLGQAITLLVIACPCALVISTPVAIYAALGNASRRGILIKGGKYLEAMAHIKAIGLDKTRTITLGKPVVSDIVPLNGTSKAELLACASGAEVFSEHPLAEAIIDACKSEGLTPHSVEKLKSIAGKGATAKCLVCEDETILIGKLAFIREHQVVTAEAEKIVEQLSSQGKTSVVVSFGAGVAGIIGLTDKIKPDSAEALQQLKHLNIEPIVLTGDSRLAAEYLANQLDIKSFFGGMLPEDKTAKIKELLLQHKAVAMVGDGVNDAPALAQATVGIAMGAAGSDAAIEVANIALMNDNLSLIPFLVRLGKVTLRRIQINTIGAIAVKLIFILLAVAGFSNLVFAIAADVGVTIVVIVSSLNLMKFNPQREILV